MDYPELGTGADGDVVISSTINFGSANKKNYASLTVNAGVIITATSGLDIRVRSVCDFNGTINMSNVRAGGDGGTGVSGGSPIAGSSGAGGGGNVIKGGDGGDIIIIGNGVDTFGGAGARKTPFLITDFDSPLPSGGGNGRVSPTDTIGGLGGTGGGAVRLRAYVIIGTGTITSNGGDGARGSITANQGCSGGAGGGAGYVELYSVTTISAITITAHGGNAALSSTNGTGYASGSGGGAGGYVIQTCQSTSAVVTNYGGSGSGAGGQTISRTSTIGRDGWGMNLVIITG